MDPPICQSLAKWRYWIIARGKSLPPPLSGDELYSEVCFRAFKCYGEEAWLSAALIKQITQIAKIDLLRKDGRRIRLLQLDEDLKELDLLSVSDDSSVNEEVELLLHLAHVLPFADRDAFLRTLRNETIAEIADACGISTEATRRRLHRAIIKMRKCIAASNHN